MRTAIEPVECVGVGELARSLAGDSPSMVSLPEIEPGAARKLARRNYRHALHRSAQLDYPAVVELMIEAVDWDPQADYFSLLGRAQEHDSSSRAAALSSYRRAVELSPADERLRIQLARLLEKLDRPEDARAVYAAALALSPEHPLVQAACRRLDRQLGAAALQTPKS